MRKITIAASALMAMAAIPATFAATDAKITNKVVIAKDAKETSFEVTLYAGTYSFTTTVGTVKVELNGEAFANVSEVLITEASKVKVTVSVAEAVAADIDVEVTRTLTSGEIDVIKSDFTQKIAIMINKTNNYKQEGFVGENETIPNLTLETSGLMAKVNAIGLADYEEYKGSNGGKIAELGTSIPGLDKEITEAINNYNGYWYAQQQISDLNKAKDELVVEYEKAEDDVKSSNQNSYDDAINGIENFVTDAKTKYDNNEYKDGNFKAEIDETVKSLKETASTVKKSIEDGSENTASYTETAGDVKVAKGVYDKVAKDLYTLLRGAEDGEVYNDIYLKSLAELSESLSEINAIEKQNETLRDKGEATTETVSDFKKSLDEIEKAINGVYTTYKDIVGTVIEPTEGTLRYYKNKADKEIEALRNSLNSIKYKDDSIKDYYKTADGGYNAISDAIDAIENEIATVNAAHTIKAEYYDGYYTAKGVVNTNISTLSGKVTTSNTHFDAKTAAEKNIGEVETAYNNAKKAVNEAKAYDEKTTPNAGKFANSYEKTIPAAIEKVKNAITAAYKVDGTGTIVTFKDGMANDSGEGENLVPGTNTIRGEITSYTTDASATLTKYNTMKQGIADATAALSDLEENATNTSVTVDAKQNADAGKNNTEIIAGTTYAEQIASYRNTINGIESAFNTAYVKKDAEYVKAMAALSFDEKLTKNIEKDKANYAGNAEAWNKAQLGAAKAIMLAEAERRLDATQLDATYDAENYGRQAGGLTTELGALKEKKDNIKSKVENAKGYPSEKDAEAIALLSEVKTELDALTSDLTALNTKANSIKTEFEAEKASYAVLTQNIAAARLALNGDGNKNKGVADYLPDGVSFAAEIKVQADAITKVEKDADASMKAETVRADRADVDEVKGENGEVTTAAKKGYDTLLKAVATATANLKTLAQNEKDNYDANKTFNEAKTEADIETKIKALSFDGITGEGRTYYEGLVGEYSTEFSNIETAQKNAYGAKTTSDLSGAIKDNQYTDTVKNMTAVASGLTTRLNTLKTNVEGIEQKAKDNEESHTAQVTAYNDAVGRRDSIFTEISQCEQSGAHEAAYNKIAEIDKALTTYSDNVAANFGKGESKAYNDALAAEMKVINESITALSSSWKGTYEAAVDAENQNHYDAFVTAYNNAKTAYSVNVNLITKMSKLSYASEAKAKEAYDTAINGSKDTKGIYAYAELIVGLKKTVDSLYAAVEAPTFFDPKEENKAKMVTYQTEMSTIADKYAKAVNKVAETTYNVSLGAVEKKLDDAIAGAEEKFDKDSVELSKYFSAVQTIIANAKENATKQDFAYLLDTEILPSFDKVDEKIKEAKEAAAKAEWEAKYNAAKTLSDAEATAIAGFYGKGLDGVKGAHSEKYATYVAESVTAAKATWDALKEGELYEMYSTVIITLDKFVARQMIEGDATVYHTEIYETAKVENDDHNKAVAANESMQAVIKEAQEKLDTAKEYAASLIIKNHVETADALASAQHAIDGITSADNSTAITRIESAYSTMFNAEKAAMASEISKVKHDYELVAAIDIENAKLPEYRASISEFETQNAKILNAYTDSPLVGEKATEEETRDAYLKLEASVGALKTELTNIYNKTAAEEAYNKVAEAIVELQTMLTGFNEQLADCHDKVVQLFEAEVDTFEVGIEAVSKELEAEKEAGTVLLYADYNLETISALKESVKNLAADINKAEKPLDVNDDKYDELIGLLDGYLEALKGVNDAAKDYKYQSESEDGWSIKETVYTNYREYKVAVITNSIEAARTDLGNLHAQEALKDDTKVTDFSLSIKKLQIELAYYNADEYITALRNKNDDAKKAFKNYAPADLADLTAIYEANKKKLGTTYDVPTPEDGSYKTYNDLAKKGSVAVDINGNSLAEVKRVEYMDEYTNTIMPALEEIEAVVVKFADDVEALSWAKGDVNKDGKINVADYSAVRYMILHEGEEGYEPSSAELYAADVTGDGNVNIGDLTRIGNYIMTGEFVSGETIAPAKTMGMRLGTMGTLALAAEGSGLAQTVKVAVDSRIPFVGGQFDVVLPTGVKLASVASASHDALMGEVNGAVRVLVSNLENTEIVNGQTFVELNVEVTSDYNGGGIDVQNAKFADAAGVVFALDDSSIATPTSLTNLTTTEKIQSKVYSVGGMLMNKMKKGINIIVNSDGTTKKQVVE